MATRSDVVRLKPYQYIHVQDNNQNITRVLVGPQTFTRQEHEVVLTSVPQQCVCIPPSSYAIVENPVLRDAENRVQFDSNGEAKVRLGDREIRFEQEPFPLFPGEVLAQDVKPLQILAPNSALRLKALRNFEETFGEKKLVHAAGDEWMVEGPCTYIPRIEVSIEAKVEAKVVGLNQALKLRAHTAFTDRTGAVRKAGEEWLWTQQGAYIPHVEEEIVELVNAAILTEQRGIHLQALQSFTDNRGKAHQAGSKWLVTFKDTQVYLPCPSERIIAEAPLVTVAKREYAVVKDFVDEKGVQQVGKKVLRKGLASFFLHPGETLEGGSIKPVMVLQKDEALLLCAKEAFTDGDGIDRQAGEQWMLQGPVSYIPGIEVQVVEKRKAIPLDVNEGVYIRDFNTGQVRAHIGSTVMLKANEELWQKPLEPLMEQLLATPRLTLFRDKEPPKHRPRVKHQVVTCNVPHNALIQIYDYQKKEARVVLGPEMVSLGPDEEFTVLSLSGSKPKEADVIKTLALHMGPDFMTDIVTVETSDHARLQLQLAYNWEFSSDVPKEKVFSVPDFVGDACKAIASRVRGFVAGESFDSFHKNSSHIIKAAVFGIDTETSQFRKNMVFKSNGLVITNVDIHSVDPVDPKTREALTKSVQLAIEITTKSQEATARHQAQALEQEARGKLERQVIQDKALSEASRKDLLEIESKNAAIESTGSSKAQAKAQGESMIIEGKSEVDLSAKRAEAAKTTADIELQLHKKKREAELEHNKALGEFEVAKSRALAEIEAEKFQKTINAVGKDTIKALAIAGPELQARLLKGLGLQGYLVTDGTNPINLFNTAKGMAAQATH